MKGVSCIDINVANIDIDRQDAVATFWSFPAAVIRAEAGAVQLQGAIQQSWFYQAADAGRLGGQDDGWSSESERETAREGWESAIPGVHAGGESFRSDWRGTGTGLDDGGGSG